MWRIPVFLLLIGLFSSFGARAEEALVRVEADGRITLKKGSHQLLRQWMEESIPVLSDDPAIAIPFTPEIQTDYSPFGWDRDDSEGGIPIRVGIAFGLSYVGPYERAHEDSDLRIVPYVVFPTVDLEVGAEDLIGSMDLVGGLKFQPPGEWTGNEGGLWHVGEIYLAIPVFESEDGGGIFAMASYKDFVFRDEYLDSKQVIRIVEEAPGPSFGGEFRGGARLGSRSQFNLSLGLNLSWLQRRTVTHEMIQNSNGSWVFGGYVVIRVNHRVAKVGSRRKPTTGMAR